MIKTNEKIILTTFSGVEIDLRNPDVKDITIFDIAHCLSNICRWNGTPRHFFSVAEHSIMAANLAPDNYKYKLAILMHDCEEAILGDNITPLKKLVPELVTIGDNMRNLLLKHFNVTDYDHEIVNKYDRVQLNWEYENIIKGGYVGLSPQKANELFLICYYNFLNYKHC